MTGQFMQRLTKLIAATPPAERGRYPYVRPAFEDTLAVAFAGWGEPVTRRAAESFPGAAELELDGKLTTGPETAALIFGAAAHALDFDDVHQSSNTHPSAPIVAALLAGSAAEPHLRERMETAYAVGLAANVGIGRVLGFPHYEKGWHATSTIGPLAAAAAAAYLFALNEEQAAFALAMASAQAGGLQRNFGAMAKPMQAGLAGAAGLRAALLARAGVTADTDVFGPKGYFDLYAGENLAEDPDQIQFDLEGGGISVKLYPCCYMTHRPIALGLIAREQLREKGLPLDDISGFEVLGPPGSYVPLRIQDPKVGSEGKFCGPYTVACALIDGAVGLAHFEDEAVGRPDVRALMERIRLKEWEGKPDGMKRRTSPMDLIARNAEGNEVLRVNVQPFPGSPDSPPSPEQMEIKVRDCLAHYERRTGRAQEYGEFQSYLDRCLGTKTRETLAAAGD